jgi:hypothetical protein
LWRDQLRIALSPQRVVAVRLSGLLRRHVAAKEILACDDTVPNWKSALDAVTQALRSRPSWQDADASVVLSNHFARYQLLPWSDEIGSDAELVAYARQSFAQVHGEAAKGWAVSVDEARRGQPSLACAVDRGLIDGLDQAFAISKSRLVSVQPYLASAFNTLRKGFADESAWFVVVEDGKLLLSLLLKGKWQAVAARKVSAETWAEELPLLLDREWRLKGIAEGPRQVYLYGPEVRNVPVLAGGAWRFEWLRPALSHGLSPQTDAPYAMALI